MASFKDIIPQFTPYIQQLPVEDMVQVGMHKQQLYDQGVQKIQSQIDNIAGLDIIHDSDRAYLQSKLDELTSNLRGVAAGDFSDQNLINSVSGMTSQLIKDKNIQNAVSSTAKFRKENARMEKAMNEGKAKAANIWKFREEANKYLSSTKIGENFSYGYEQYDVDNQKTALEAIKSVHPSLSQVDITHVVNEDGSIDYNQLSDVMKRNKIEGVTSLQIQKAISAAFGADNWRQLQLDGEYQLKGISNEQLKEYTVRQYEELVKDNKKQLDHLKSLKKITVNPEEVNKLDEQIGDYEYLLGDGKTPGKLEKDYLNNLKTIDEDPSIIKGEIYKNGFIKQFGDAFSWTSQTSEILKNPYVEVEQWNKRFALDVQTENRNAIKDQFDMNIATENLQIRKEEIKLKAEENALKKAEIYGIEGASTWQPLTDETDNSLNSEKYYNDHVQSVINGAKAERQKLMDAGYSKKEIDMALNNLRDSNPDNNKSIDPRILKSLQTIDKDENYANALISKQKQLRAEANREVGLTAAQQNALKNKPSLNINWNNKNYKLSPEEILQIKSSTKETTQSTRFGSKRVVSVDTKGFNKNQLDFVNGMKGILYGEFLPGTPPKPGVDELRGKINQVTSKYNEDIKNIGNLVKKSNDLLNKKLANLTGKMVPQVKAAPMNKDGKITPAVAGTLSAMITSRQLGKYGTPGTDDDKASEFLNDDNIKNTKVFVKQQGNDYEIWIKNEKDPENIQKYKVDPGRITALFGPGYVNDTSNDSMRKLIGKGNTNLTNDPNLSLMKKSFGDFPRVRKLNITADLPEDLSNSDEHIISINLKKKNGRWQNFRLSDTNNLGRVGFEQGKQLLNNLSDSEIIKYIKVEYPNYDFSQLQGY